MKVLAATCLAALVLSGCYEAALTGSLDQPPRLTLEMRVTEASDVSLELSGVLIPGLEGKGARNPVSDPEVQLGLLNVAPAGIDAGRLLYQLAFVGHDALNALQAISGGAVRLPGVATYPPVTSSQGAVWTRRVGPPVSSWSDQDLLVLEVVTMHSDGWQPVNSSVTWVLQLRPSGSSDQPVSLQFTGTDHVDRLVVAPIGHCTPGVLNATLAVVVTSTGASPYPHSIRTTSTLTWDVQRTCT